MLLRVLCVSVLVLLAVPGTIAAQAGSVWLEARGGWLVPTSDLGRTDIIDNSGFGVFERVDGSPVLAVGLGVELGNRWAVRASLDRAFNATVLGEWKCVPFVACPAVLLPLNGEMTRWTAMVDAMVRPAVGFPAAPVLFAGLGVRRSGLTWGEPAADITLPAFTFDETNLVFRAGVGLERALGKTTLFGELEMTTTRFGGGSYESIEGNVAAERDLKLEMGLVGGARVRLR